MNIHRPKDRFAKQRCSAWWSRGLSPQNPNRIALRSGTSCWGFIFKDTEHLIILNAILLRMTTVPRLEAVGLIEVEELRTVDLAVNQNQFAADELAGLAQHVKRKAKQFRAADSPGLVEGEVLAKMRDEIHPYPGFSGIIYPGFSRDP